MASLRFDKLYAFGSNGSGQLGVGHCEDLWTPRQCLFRFDHSPENGTDVASGKELHNDRIRQIAAGGNHTLLLTERGQVFASGNNEDGRCGFQPQEAQASTFILAEACSSKVITNVAAAWAASYFVENDRKVFVLGSGDKGELGLGEEVTRTAAFAQAFDIPEDVSDNTSILRIAASVNHVVVLLSNGEVHGWGACRKGQLGEEHKTEKVSWTPCKLSTPFHVRHVAVGRDYTILVGMEGESVMLGDTKYFPPNSDFSLGHFDDLQSGWSSILCLEKGVLVGFGRGDRGQLPPVSLGTMTGFAAGSEHAIGLGTSQNLVAWGWGEHGNCGMPVDDRGNAAGSANIIKLQTEPGHHIAGVAAGCATSFVWTREHVH